MLVCDLLTPACIRVDFTADDKPAVLRRLCQLALAASDGLDEEQVFEALAERERVATTGVGSGVALPHAWLDIEVPRAALIVSTDGVPFDTLDGGPVFVVLALVCPRSRTAEHLRLLLRVSRLLSDQGLCARLRAAASPEDALEIWALDETRR